MLVDREVLELLRDDPELLAISDAIAATQTRRGDIGRTSAMTLHDPSPLRRADRLWRSLADQ